MTEKEPTKPRLLQLDILRGLAILLVLGRHAPLKWTEAGPLKHFAGAWGRVGWSGVDMFFVLSGFLVGGLLFKELATRGEMDVRRFIIRRGFKIWPSYYLNLIVTTVIFFLIWKGEPAVTWQDILPNFLHVQNYFYNATNPVQTLLGPTWSLGVEEHFYLALPLLVLFLTVGRKHKFRALQAIPVISVLLIFLCALLRWIAVYSDPGRINQYYMYTHLRMDSLFLGVMLSYLNHFQRPVLDRLGSHRLALAIAVPVLLSPVLMAEVKRSHALVSVGITSTMLGYAALLVLFLYTPVGEGRLGRILASAPLRLIGAIGFYSYTIYLWHTLLAVKPIEMLALRGVMPPSPVRWLLFTLAYVLLAIGTGAIMGILVDNPMLALRDRLFPARTKGLVTPLDSEKSG